MINFNPRMKSIRFSLLALFTLCFSAGIFAQSPSDNSEPADAKKEVSQQPVLLNLGNSAVEAPEPELTTMQFEEYNYDFGEIKQGDTVEHGFKFKNTGDFDLVIENVKPSCGCTALDWPKDPIAPGDGGIIKAQFNSTGKSGKQNKYITITFNGNPRIERVAFTGTIVLPEHKDDHEGHDHTH